MLPLDYTIDLTLKGIYGDKEIDTTIFIYLSYLHWKSFFSMTWKKDTLRPLIRRAYTFVRKIIFCGKNYTVEKNLSLSLMVTQNGY